MPKTSSIRPVISIQYRRLTEGRRDGHTTTAYIAIVGSWRRAEKIAKMHRPSKVLKYSEYPIALAHFPYQSQFVVEIMRAKKLDDILLSCGFLTASVFLYKKGCGCVVPKTLFSASSFRATLQCLFLF